MVEIEVIVLSVGWLLAFLFFYRPNFPSKSIDSSWLPPRVSIVIPARNEESNLRVLLASIQNQTHKPFEVIVMNDHSEDQTALVAQELGARVIQVPALPEGWNGKPFACFEGAKHATGEYLLFLDADVFFEADGLEKIMSLPSKGAGVWSICPFHRVQKLYEEFSSVFNLMMVVGTGAFSAWGKNKARLTGQAFLVSKKNYELVGGHEVVKNRVLENFFLTDFFHALGISTYTLGGKGSISMRMFPDGFQSLVLSWKKGFVTGASKTPASLMVLIVAWISAGFSAFIFISQSIFNQQVSMVFAVIYFLFVLQIRWMYRNIGTFSWVSAMLYPLFFVFFMGLFFYSMVVKMFGQKTSWKGRHVS
jgi:4,4'-diaponeurosporenoate glycosyltransferase